MIARLPAQDDAQRDLRRHLRELVAANSRTRVLLLSQVNDDLPTPIVLVVGFWLVTLFLAFGLLARPNAVAVTALLTGAASWFILQVKRPWARARCRAGGADDDGVAAPR